MQTPDYTHYTKRTVVAEEIYSAHLSEVRTLKIFLPPGYAESGRYPVLYCHDGNEFFTHGRIATIANMMISKGLLRPLLIVGIATRPRARTGEYALGGERHAAYLRFVAEECLPFVESAFAVDARPESRFMAGVSLGGTAALDMHRHWPDLLFKLLLFSGAFVDFIQVKPGQETTRQITLGPEKPEEDVPLPEGGGVRTLGRPSRELSRLPQPPDPAFALRAFMRVGTRERDVETPTGRFDFLAANRAMRDAWTRQGAELDYREKEGAHVWGFWQENLPSAFEWLEKNAG